MSEEPTSNRKRNNRLAIAAIIVAVLFTLATNKEDKPSTKLKQSTHVSKIPKAPVYNSEWDGSVVQVTNYLKSNLNDWDSYESMEWSKVIASESGNYLIRHKYRAANGFGAKIIVHQFFEVSPSGQIVSVTDF